MPGLRRETLVAIDAMTSALTIARHGIKAEDITSKSGRDVVTVADLAVEDAVRATLVDALGFSVVGEERGGEIVDRLPYWLLDPVCGTRTRICRNPLKPAAPLGGDSAILGKMNELGASAARGAVALLVAVLVCAFVDRLRGLDVVKARRLKERVGWIIFTVFVLLPALVSAVGVTAMVGLCLADLPFCSEVLSGKD